MAKCNCPPTPRRKAQKAAHRRTAYGDPYRDIHHVDTHYEIVDAARGAFGNDIYVFKTGTGGRIELGFLRDPDHSPMWRLAVNGTVIEEGCTQADMVARHHCTLQLFEMIGHAVPFGMLPR